MRGHHIHQIRNALVVGIARSQFDLLLLQSVLMSQQGCRMVLHLAGGADNGTLRWWNSLLPAFPSARKLLSPRHVQALNGLKNET